MDDLLNNYWRATVLCIPPLLGALIITFINGTNSQSAIIRSTIFTLMIIIEHIVAKKLYGKENNKK
jgi:hypothetical protein